LTFARRYRLFEVSLGLHLPVMLRRQLRQAVVNSGRPSSTQAGRRQLRRAVVNSGRPS
jgi:hypothetical protein